MCSSHLRALARAARFDAVRLAALEASIEGQLRVGGSALVAFDLAAACPSIARRLVAQLMRALYAGGRHKETFDVFRRASEHLAEFGPPTHKHCRRCGHLVSGRRGVCHSSGLQQRMRGLRRGQVDSVAEARLRGREQYCAERCDAPSVPLDA
jgi:hypothetical protein